MVRILGPLVASFFVACWVAFLMHQAGFLRLPYLPRLTLRELFSGSSALGWTAGMVYVQRTRHLAGPLRRRLLLLCFFGPPGVLFLAAAMGRLAVQAPLAVVWALGVFAIFFCVPVAFRSAGSDRRV